MRHSDIFDEFAKIAEKQGLISTSSTEEIKRKLEENPRMDSLDISAIEALYGVKPDAPKNMSYERNIIDQAHPNSVVVSPSYDKLNGLVENVNERQNIILNIINKQPTGEINQKKYAEQQLILSLVKIANDLDNKRKTDLRILADTCLEQTSGLKKKASPLLTGVLIAVPALLGALWLHQHLPFLAKEITLNTNQLIKEIDDLINNSVNWGIGAKYTQSFVSEMRKFRTKVSETYNKYLEFKPVLDSLKTPKTAKELLELSKTSQAEEIKKFYNMFDAHITNFIPYIRMTIDNFKEESYKLQQIDDKGVFEQLVDWTQFLHGGKGLVADDFDDVVRAAEAYIKVILRVKEDLSKAQKYVDTAKAQLASGVQEASQTTQEKAPEPAPAKSKSELDESAPDLVDALSNLK
jgi:hypothetical protein